ncbi:MAG: zinc-binding dehydrogenase, partial [Microlunatus sp.]|nr:zinc-binding dehydrogenase [Microlunatus sp.]
AAAGPDKLDGLQELQPDASIDYTQPGWEARIPTPPTVVLDGVGGDIGRTALDSAAPGARIVMFGFSSGTSTALATADLVRGSLSVSWALGPRMAAYPGGTAGLARRAVQLGGQGGWQPLVTSYPLADAARAHRDLEERRTVGKVVLIS